MERQPPAAQGGAEPAAATAGEAAEGAVATKAQEEAPAEAMAVEVQEEAPVEAGVDAKRAPSAKHTASRTSWLHTCKESQDVPVNFS
jgi:hypothetical protein